MNSKNKNAKKDKRLSYSQGNKSTYPPTAKAMAIFLSIQYPNKNIGHQRNSKKGNKNGQNGNASKPEEKDNTTTGTTGAHVGEVTAPKNAAVPSNESSIGAYVLEVAKHKSRPV